MTRAKLGIIGLLLLVTTPALASATNVYITQSGAATGACAVNVQTPTFFNTAASWGAGANQIGPGTTVHLCGTFTAAANANLFTFNGSGSSGNVITLLFEAGAQLTAPYFAYSSGAIDTNGNNFITIDGNGVGIIQSTANGDALANKQNTVAIVASPCGNCTVKNLTIQNLYVHTQGSSIADIDPALVQAVRMTGSNWLVSGNTIHDCGWCLSDAFGSGDTNVEIAHNDIYHFDHGLLFAASFAHAATNVFFHDNRVHDPANWDCTADGCHHDGIHVFGTTGSSVSGFYVYNNYFYGDWGQTPTGFIFIEGGADTPAHMSNQYYWNNVGVVPSGAVINTNGWIGIFSGDSGVTALYNNTIIGPNATDNTACFSIQGVNNLTFKNNTVHSCGDPVNVGSLTSFAAANFDDNFYGTSCSNSGNCFVWNGSFTGSFANWKTACGCDASSQQNDTALLETDGTPEASSPVIQMGVNLTSIATGNLVTLLHDTSRGGTRGLIARPATGHWDVGAYQFGTPLPFDGGELDDMMNVVNFDLSGADLSGADLSGAVSDFAGDTRGRQAKGCSCEIASPEPPRLPLAAFALGLLMLVALRPRSRA